MTTTSNPEAAPHALIARAVIWKGGRLLANRARNAAGEPYAALPGGHVDPGEDCKLALARELEEELLAKISVGDLIFVAEAKYLGGKKGNKPRHEVVLFFEAELQNELEEVEGRLASPEPQKNFGWLSPEEWGERNLVPHALRGVLAGGSAQRYDFRDMLPAESAS